jgi:hypothetical protein
MHRDSLRSVLKTTNDIHHREALLSVIAYLGNRLADVSEQSLDPAPAPWLMLHSETI